MTKSGWKTSEFYVAIAGLGGLVWTFAQQHCQVDSAALMAFAGVVVTYIVGRSWVKSKVY